METKVNKISQCENEVEVVLSYDEIKDNIAEAYKKESKNISVPGFRKGKVPKGMLKKMYGEAIEYRASEDIANKKFWEVVESEKLEPISAPSMVDLDFVPDEKLTFKIRYEVKPELELKDYKGLEIEKPIFKIKDADIVAEIDGIKKSKASFEEAKKVTSKKYRINVNLQRKDTDGNILEGQKSENIAIDLSDPNVNKVIPTNAKGKAVGDTFEFSFVDEHNHGDEVHKEEFNYDAEITKIEKIVLPEENEAFFEEVSNKKAKTMDELKAHLKKNYEDYMASQAENMYQNNLLKAVIDNNEFDVPKGYVETLYHRLVDMEKQNAQRQGQPFNESVVKEQMKPRAEWNAKWQIILENLAKAENIEVNDDDLKAMAEKEAESTGISVDKLVKYYQDSGRKESLLEEKVIKFLEENNKVKEVDPAAKTKKASKKKTTTKASDKKEKE